MTDRPAPCAIEAVAEGITRIRFPAGAQDGGGRQSYLSPGAALVRDAAAAAPAMDAAVAARLDAAGEGIEILGATGAPVLRIRFADVATGPGTRLRATLAGQQHFYGLGESGQQFDRLGAARRLWNSQGNHGSGGDIAIPLLVSTAGYALFFDNPSRSWITAGDSVGPAAAIEYHAEAGALDLYVVAGADLRGVLGGVARLLGRAPMPPRWALGFMQSSRFFDDADDLLGLLRTMREKRLPCDAFIFLSTYDSGQGWNRGVGHLEFHPGLLPDPAALLAEMRALGFRVFAHEYPALHRDSPLHAEAAANGYLLGYGYPDQRPHPPGSTNYREGQRFIDFSDPEARRWWWDAHRPLLEAGIDAWWLDGGEGPPADAALRAGPGLTVHNRYDLLRQQAFAEGEARDRPDRRAFLLCRSGGPGMQRFGAAAWSGDVNCSFATLEEQVAVGLNLAMSGVPWWGTDIGGFYKVDADNAELFARWFQFGAFCPVFRAHGHSWREHLPWSHGPAVEAICRRYLELRYRLLPYAYTLAAQAHRDGLPMMRPMVLNYPGDARFWQVGTQYLWGDDLLVAPVTRAGATHWPVLIPDSEWQDYWTGETHRGPCAVTVAAPLDRLPLFLRAGAIIPLGPARQCVDAAGEAEITLLVVPAARGAGALYDDDGATHAYRDGRCAVTTFAMARDEDGLVIEVAPPAGDASVIPAGRRYVLSVRMPHPPRAVEGAGPEAWRHDPKEGVLTVPLGASGRVRILP